MITSAPSRLRLIFITCCLASFLAPLLQADPDTVSVVLVDGDMREDWPDNGVVGFRRQNSSGDLVVNYSVGGTAVSGTDYTVPAGTTITIPDGDREAWLEFAPSGQAFLVVPAKTTLKTIVVTALAGTGYNLAPAVGKTTFTSATVALGNSSALPSQKAAVRFLNQAAFGANGDLKNVAEVAKKGYDKWITDQFARPADLQQPYLTALSRARHGKIYSETKLLGWWKAVMNNAANADPLRQRVAFALSELFVISDHFDELANQPIGMANYYDMLVKNAFGNFRTLLYSVATHPCMGAYLSHLQNEKGDPTLGTFADENFAREVMQLLTIGLWQLNPDGTRQLDSNSQPIPSYDNTTVANMARVMTGFGFGGPKSKGFWDAPDNFVVPMRMWDEYHDVGSKTFLGTTLAASTASDPDMGTAGMADFNAAIDTLFNHQNTAPFISRQLIQRLVTSNPSSAYVGRVAAAFVNNGSGVRGDMKAVIRAVLMDDEARNPANMSNPQFGKMKEPYLRTVTLARAFDAKAPNGVYDLEYLQDIFSQAPFASPSVFNFFKPGYSPDGAISDAGLVAPEFQLLNAVTALGVPNYYLYAINDGLNSWWTNKAGQLVKNQYTNEMKLVEDVPALLRRLDLIMTAGTLPKEQHEIIREAVESIDKSADHWQLERVCMAVYLIATAPEFGITH